MSMVLSDRDLLKLIENGDLKITDFDIKQLGPTSIDLRLNPHIVKYSCEKVDLCKSEFITNDIIIDENGYELLPSEFIVASTYEKVTIPNGYQAFIETRGCIARAGLQVHNADGHIDPGSDHVITLEIVNNNNIPVIIYPNMYICQIFILKLTSECDKPYSGKYLGQTTPTIYKP